MMLARPILCLALFTVAGCAEPVGQPLVSAQFPPGTGAVNVASEPQTLNSLPPGAANFSTAPGATAPNYLSFAFKAI